MRKNLMNILNPKEKEVKKMKRLLVVAICTAFVMMASVAFATTITPVDVNTPDGTVNIAQMDWAPGSGLSVNGNPEGPGGAGNPLDLKYQAFMSVFLNALNTAVSTPNLNTDTAGDGINPYEFTVTANIWENVASTTVLPDGSVFSKFNLSANATNLVTVWFDSTADANVAAGTGFNNGIAAITGTPISLTGSFLTSDTNGNGIIDNQDTGVGSSDIIIRIDTVDNSIFPDLQPGGLWISHFIGTQNTPPEGVDTAMMFDGTIPDYFTGGTVADARATNDILLKIDGNSHFTPVPEPGTMMLLGSGLAGLCFASALRRRKK